MKMMNMKKIQTVHLWIEQGRSACTVASGAAAAAAADNSNEQNDDVDGTVVGNIFRARTSTSNERTNECYRAPPRVMRGFTAGTELPKDRG